MSPTFTSYSALACFRTPLLALGVILALGAGRPAIAAAPNTLDCVDRAMDLNANHRTPSGGAPFGPGTAGAARCAGKPPFRAIPVLPRPAADQAHGHR